MDPLPPFSCKLLLDWGAGQSQSHCVAKAPARQWSPLPPAGQARWQPPQLVQREDTRRVSCDRLAPVRSPSAFPPTAFSSHVWGTAAQPHHFTGKGNPPTPSLLPQLSSTVTSAPSRGHPGQQRQGGEHSLESPSFVNSQNNEWLPSKPQR